jgi:hypothetical protein
MKKLLFCSIAILWVIGYKQHLFSKPLLAIAKQARKIVPFPMLNSKLPNADSIVLARLKMHGVSLKNFAKLHHYNDSLAFIVDFSIASGKPRIFLYNLSADSIITKGLVTHGSGLGSTEAKPVFGNKVGCLASAKGFYKIGQKYAGKFGLAYRLHGLQVSNNKAFERAVVFHSHSCVPLTPVYPLNICMSYGCPTVNPIFLQSCMPFIEQSPKNMLISLF